MWKKLSEDEKAQYEEDVLNINQERARARMLKEASMGVKPVRPKGPFGCFYEEKNSELEDAGKSKLKMKEAIEEWNKLTDAQKEAYTTVGGTPHLDGQYTVFGEVTEGLDIVESIQKAPTLRGDRPKEDIRILKTEVE